MSAWKKSLLGGLLILMIVPVSPALAQNESRLVWNWYRLYLHRRPDPSGLQNCVYQLQSGATPTAVQGGLLGSDEYYQLHGSNPVGLIRGLYEDVVGREVSRRATAYWLDQLNRDGGNRQQLAVDFLNWANGR